MVRLITGPAKSGKSRFAQSLADMNSCLHIDASDPSEAEKSENEILRRPSGCISFSAYRDLDELLFSDTFLSQNSVILDDAASMLRRTYKEVLSDADDPDEAQLSRCEERVKDEILRLAAICRNKGKDLSIVTEESGTDFGFSHKLLKAYKESLGRINFVAAKTADEAYLLSRGTPIKLKCITYRGNCCEYIDS